MSSPSEEGGEIQTPCLRGLFVHLARAVSSHTLHKSDPVGNARTRCDLLGCLFPSKTGPFRFGVGLDSHRFQPREIFEPMLQGEGSDCFLTGTRARHVRCGVHKYSVLSVIWAKTWFATSRTIPTHCMVVPMTIQRRISQPLQLNVRAKLLGVNSRIGCGKNTTTCAS